MHDDDDEDWEEDDEPLVPCPYCKRDIPEDVPRCPYCENYISGEDAPATAKPAWIVAGVIVCLIVIYFWITK